MSQKELPESKKLSIEQENRISKIFKGVRTPRSGGGGFVSGDVLTPDNTEGLSSWLVECKTTVKPSLSYSVNKAILDKADHERLEMHKQHYALAFTLGENRDDYFVINKRTMQAVLSQQESIRELISTIQAELDELEERMKTLKTTAKVTEQESLLYSAHKAEKQAILYSLRELV